MTLSITNIGANPFVPGVAADLFIPDQLIAGNFHLVTQPIVVASGAAVLARGTVLGQVTALGADIVTPGTNVGTGTVGSVTTGSDVQVGTFSLVASGASTFFVTNPEGTSLPNATVGTAYSNSGLGFTIASGGVAFAAGDSFGINVVDAVGAFIPSVKTASDGSQTPCAILVDQCNPTTGAQQAGAYMTGEFNINAITFDTSWTPQALVAALRAFSIFLKTSESATVPGTVVQNFA
jgi:hypothetical protein